MIGDYIYTFEDEIHLLLRHRTVCGWQRVCVDGRKRSNYRAPVTSSRTWSIVCGLVILGCGVQSSGCGERQEV